MNRVIFARPTESLRVYSGTASPCYWLTSHSGVLRACLLVTLILFVLCHPLRAKVLTFSENTTINYQISEDTVNVVAGPNPPTFVILEEVAAPPDPWGSPTRGIVLFRSSLRTYDSSVVTIVGVLGGSSVLLHDSSVVNFSNGALVVDSTVTARDSSTVDFSGAQVLDSPVTAQDFSTVNFSDTEFRDQAAYRFPFVQARDSSTVNVQSGEVNMVFAYHSATVNVFGGRVGFLFASGASTVNVYGGRIGQRDASSLQAEFSATMNIFGSEFNYPPGPIPDAIGTLTGTLADGEPINSPFYIPHDDASIILHYVPEPSTFWLTTMAALGLLTCALRRRKRATNCRRAQNG